MGDKEKLLLEKLQEEEWTHMGEKYNSDYKMVEDLAYSCLEPMLNNKIYIVENKQFKCTQIVGYKESLSDFERVFSDVEEAEDLKNFRIRIERQSYKIDNEENGFTIFYPKICSSTNFNIDVEIVTNLSDYLSLVLGKKKKQDYSRFYRGHTNWRYELKPGIYREDNCEFLNNESSYIMDILTNYPQYFSDCNTALDYLARLQHNGFPTRLLDFSENPLIALYMACDNNYDAIGNVILIDVPKQHFKYFDSDSISILSNIAFSSDETINDLLNDEDKYAQNIAMERFISRIKQEKPYFENKIEIESIKDKILFVKAKHNFNRIMNQDGLFALFSVGDKRISMPTIEQMTPECQFTHYIVPRECKEAIIDELACINVTEATVYCDLEHTANHYKKRPKTNALQNNIEKQEKEQSDYYKSIFK